MIFFAFSTASRLQASRAVPWQVANVTRHPTSPRFFFRSKLRCQHLHYPRRNETKPNRKQGPNIAGSTNICIWTVFHAVFAVPLLSLYSILICFGLKSKQVTGVLWGLWTKCIRLLINSLDALQSNSHCSTWKRNDYSLQPAKSALVAWLSSYWPQTNHRMLAFAAGSFILHDDNKLRVWHHGPERGSNWHIIKTNSWKYHFAQTRAFFFRRVANVLVLLHLQWLVMLLGNTPRPPPSQALHKCQHV